MSLIVSSVGRRVRQLRTRAGMTQERLAERAEISVSFLSMIERGERSPHLDTLDRLALALEVAVEEIFRPNLAVDEAGSGAQRANVVRERRAGRAGDDGFDIAAAASAAPVDADVGQQKS